MKKILKSIIELLKEGGIKVLVLIIIILSFIGTIIGPETASIIVFFEIFKTIVLFILGCLLIGLILGLINRWQ